MSFLDVKYSKGQMKIQQMAFVLVAMMIFFSMVALVFFSIYYNSLAEDVTDIREQEAKEIVRKLSGTPEFSWEAGGNCPSCIDMDKALMLANRTSYQNFWRGIPYIQLVKVHPAGEGECTVQNYPDCGAITIVDDGGNVITHSSFVALCRQDPSEGYGKCEIGKIIVGFEPVN